MRLAARPGNLELVPQHPLARQLLRCWVADQRRGVQTLVDIAGQRVLNTDRIDTSVKLVAPMSDWRAGLGYSSCVHQDTNGKIAYAADYTLAILARFTNNSNWNGLFAKTNSDGTTTGLAIQRVSDTDDLRVYHTTTESATYAGLWAEVADDNYHFILLTYKQADDEIKLFVDGENKGTNTLLQAASIDTEYLKFLSSRDDLYVNGRAALIAFWTRNMATSEAQQLGQDPWVFLRPPKRVKIWEAAGILTAGDNSSSSQSRSPSSSSSQSRLSSSSSSLSSSSSPSSSSLSSSSLSSGSSSSSVSAENSSSSSSSSSSISASLSQADVYTKAEVDALLAELEARIVALEECCFESSSSASVSVSSSSASSLSSALVSGLYPGDAEMMVEFVGDTEISATGVGDTEIGPK